MRPIRRFMLFGALPLVGCAAPASPPPSTSNGIEWLTLETGRACARAEVACGVGNCVARIDNTCDEPLTCELAIQCVCQAYTGESGEARSRASDTAPAKGKVGLEAHAICGAGEVKATFAEAVRCK
ncbi:MAG: hypothetical protein FJ095_13965 [Deltaproteobacteria bacterium]|nr:hypothetical protein [Deltaproteobacteria bacterium]